MVLKLKSAANSAPEYGPLKERLGYALRRAQLAVFQDFFVTFEPFRISPSQYSILTIIDENPGLSQTQVADALAIKKANFVAVIQGLEARGLVQRTPTPLDRRFYALHLSEGGKTLLRQLHQKAAELEAELTNRLGENSYRELLSLLQKLSHEDHFPREPVVSLLIPPD